MFKKRDLGLISYKQETAGVGGFAEKELSGLRGCAAKGSAVAFFLIPDDKK